MFSISSTHLITWYQQTCLNCNLWGGLHFSCSMTTSNKFWFPYFFKAQPIPCIKQLKFLEYFIIWLRYDPKLNTRLGNEKLRKMCLKLGKFFMQGCSYLHRNTIKHLKFLWGFDTIFDKIEKWLIAHKKLKCGKTWKIDFFFMSEAQ